MIGAIGPQKPYTGHNLVRPAADTMHGIAMGAGVRGSREPAWVISRDLF